MSFESEDFLDSGKSLENESTSFSEIDKTKTWLRSSQTSSPPADEGEAAASTADTSQETTFEHLPPSSPPPSTMPKPSSTSGGMQTRSGCRTQSKKCRTASPESSPKSSEVTPTPRSDVRITRSQHKRAMQSDPSSTTPELGTLEPESTSRHKQRKSKGKTGKTARCPSPPRLRGERSHCTRNTPLMSKCYHPKSISSYMQIKKTTRREDTPVSAIGVALFGLLKYNQ